MADRLSTSQSAYFAEVAYRGPLDPVVASYAEPKMAFLAQHVPLTGRILDIGCGNGIFTHRFARYTDSVVGLDFSPRLLRENPHNRLICGDATKLPFPDESFDLSFEANLLHHVADRNAVIGEMARVSRKYVAILEPNRNNPLMLGFGLVVKTERGSLVSTPKHLRGELTLAGLKLVASITTGMISQNNTPKLLVPFLRRFNKPIWWGEYIVMVAERPSADFGINIPATQD
jgi:ubiquinone/menaquinone biosynthesis C-methylase UbiE